MSALGIFLSLAVLAGCASPAPQASDEDGALSYDEPSVEKSMETSQNSRKSAIDFKISSESMSFNLVDQESFKVWAYIDGEPIEAETGVSWTVELNGDPYTFYDDFDDHIEVVPSTVGRYIITAELLHLSPANQSMNPDSFRPTVEPLEISQELVHVSFEGSVAFRCGISLDELGKSCGDYLIAMPTGNSSLAISTGAPVDPITQPLQIRDLDGNVLFQGRDAIELSAIPGLPHGTFWEIYWNSEAPDLHAQELFIQHVPLP